MNQETKPDKTKMLQPYIERELSLRREIQLLRRMLFEKRHSDSNINQTKMKTMFLVLSVSCCLPLFAEAETGTRYSWLTATPSDPSTTCLLDKYYHMAGIYTGSGIHAGIIQSQVVLHSDSLPDEEPQLTDISEYVGYTDMYGRTIVDTINSEALRPLIEGFGFLESFQETLVSGFSITRGGQYNFRNTIPGIGYDYTKVIEIQDEPSVRLRGCSVVTGEDFHVEARYNTGYPYEVSQFNGNEKAVMTLYSLSENNNGEELQTQVSSQEQTLALYRPDQPLVAAVDTMKMNVEKPAPGKYLLKLSSDWQLEDANTEIVLSVNDTLRATAQLDKIHYEASDDEGHLTITTNYGYPHIAIPTGADKPELGIEFILVDTCVVDGVKQSFIIDQGERILASDSLATKDLNETFEFEFSLPDIAKYRKSEADCPLHFIVNVKFNGVKKTSFMLPFYCEGSTTCVSSFHAPAEENAVYDLFGRRIQNEKMTKGLYFQNNRRVFVK